MISPRDLREIFAGADADDEFLDLAHASSRAKPLRIRS